jgi:hypothetical protein
MIGLAPVLGEIGPMVNTIKPLMNLSESEGQPAEQSTEGMSDDQFIGVVSAMLCACAYPDKIPRVCALWKANYASYAADSDDAQWLHEQGVLSTADQTALTKGDKQLIALLALAISASTRKPALVEGSFDPTYEGLHTPGNLKFFKSQGWIS